jgi:hypothetical protein
MNYVSMLFSKKCYDEDCVNEEYLFIVLGPIEADLHVLILILSKITYLEIIYSV